MIPSVLIAFLASSLLGFAFDSNSSSAINRVVNDACLVGAVCPTTNDFSMLQTSQMKHLQVLYMEVGGELDVDVLGRGEGTVVNDKGKGVSGLSQAVIMPKKTNKKHA